MTQLTPCQIIQEARYAMIDSNLEDEPIPPDIIAKWLDCIEETLDCDGELAAIALDESLQTQRDAVHKLYTKAYSAMKIARDASRKLRARVQEEHGDDDLSID